MRDKANTLIEMCQDGVLDPMDVLENVLTNYMSSDDANDFAESEYGIEDEYDEYDDDEEDEDDLIKSK